MIDVKMGKVEGEMIAKRGSCVKIILKIFQMLIDLHENTDFSYNLPKVFHLSICSQLSTRAKSPYCSSWQLQQIFDDASQEVDSNLITLLNCIAFSDISYPQRWPKIAVIGYPLHLGPPVRSHRPSS